MQMLEKKFGIWNFETKRSLVFSFLVYGREQCHLWACGACSCFCAIAALTACLQKKKKYIDC